MSIFWIQVLWLSTWHWKIALNTCQSVCNRNFKLCRCGTCMDPNNFQSFQCESWCFFSTFCVPLWLFSCPLPPGHGDFSHIQPVSWRSRRDGTLGQQTRSLANNVPQAQSSFLTMFIMITAKFDQTIKWGPCKRSLLSGLLGAAGLWTEPFP